jgi:hypothetical protein
MQATADKMCYECRERIDSDENEVVAEGPSSTDYDMLYHEECVTADDFYFTTEPTQMAEDCMVAMTVRGMVVVMDNNERVKHVLEFETFIEALRLSAN